MTFSKSSLLDHKRKACISGLLGMTFQELKKMFLKHFRLSVPLSLLGGGKN